MTTLHEVRREPRAPDLRGASSPAWWLRLTVPIVVLGVGASLAGLLLDRVYAHETPSWRSEATGQDIANLVVLAALGVLGYAAARGSLRALLAWTGAVAYTAYTYAIYSFDVHFGPMFLVHVAVLAAAVWALIGALGSLDPARVRAAFVTTPARNGISTLLLVLAGGFALLWLGQDVPATFDGSVPTALRDTGLPTNPVHVLDLALFLPTAVVAGVQLRGRRPWGSVLAPVVLVAMAAISLGIVSAMGVHLVRGEDASLAVAVTLGAIGALQAFLAWWLLRGVAAEVSVAEVRRRPAGAAPAGASAGGEGQ